MVLAGVGLFIFVPGELGVHGLSMAAGAGFAVLLLNWLFRMSVSGERDREREEEARRYFDAHGSWPDDKQNGHASPNPGPRTGEPAGAADDAPGRRGAREVPQAISVTR